MWRNVVELVIGPEEDDFMRNYRISPFLLLVAALGCGSEDRSTGTAATEPFGSVSITAAGGQGGQAAGAVFTLNNNPSGNAVMVFPRNEDGSLGAPTRFPTGGTGTGGGLGNQGALTYSPVDQLLCVVNPGSNSISTLRATSAGLQLVETVASGGERPISLTRHGQLLYVLNAGGPGGIAGFRLTPGGNLISIPKSAQPLGSIAAGSAQIGFSPNGRHLVVTEKATNTISVYSVGANGRPSEPFTQPSNGQTPFGFEFDPAGHLIVSEAFGGAPGLSVVSSYSLEEDGTLTVITGSMATTQSAACWIAISGGGQFAYATNTGSDNITGFAIGAGGTLARLDTDGITATSGDGPIDAAFAGASRFLYVLNGRDQTLSAFERGDDGALAPLPGMGGLPMGANGLAAR